MFPRGGGIWDQDPILIRDFRYIQKFEREWKDAQQKMDEMKSSGDLGFSGGVEGPTNQGGGGGGSGLEGALNSYLESMGEDGTF